MAAHETEEDLRADFEMNGVRGSLAEHLDVSAEMESALVAALGGALDALLVDDDAVAHEVAQAVQGRVGIISLAEATVAAEGLSAKIGGTPEGRAAVAMLLQNCREAQTLTEAIELNRRTGASSVVTSAGMHGFVDSRGVFLSASSAVVQPFFSRRQLTELQQEDLADQSLAQARTALSVVRTGMSRPSNDKSWRTCAQRGVTGWPEWNIGSTSSSRRIGAREAPAAN